MKTIVAMAVAMEKVMEKVILLVRFLKSHRLNAEKSSKITSRQHS